MHLGVWTKSLVVLCLIHTAGVGGCNEAAIIHNGIIEAESTGEVVSTISISFQNSGGDIASKTTLAHDINWFLLWEFF